MLNSASALQRDCFEIIVLKFVEGLSSNEQAQEMNKLNSIVENLAGFKSRDFYYSESDNRWVEFLVWQSPEAAKKASELVMQNQNACSIFSKIDNSSMIFSHYNHMGGTKK